MKQEQKENYILLSNISNSFTDFFFNFKKEYDTLKENHIIIQFSESINMVEDDIFVFLKYAKLHQENGTTFVIIKSELDIDKFPEWFNIVPSLIEAEDVLEMEEIQRDLKF